MSRQRVINLIVARHKQLPYLNSGQREQLELNLKKVDPKIAFNISQNFEKKYLDLYNDSDDDILGLLSIFNPVVLPAAICESLDADAYWEAVEFCRKNMDVYKETIQNKD